MSGTGRRPHINPMVAGFGAGVLIALIVGLMAAINLQYGAPWADTKTLTAQVSDADSMSVGSDVRIAGRLVGQVVSITADGTYTDIVFHVDGGDWPLPADTTASVRLATLLGQKYIQLNPGHSSQMLTDNAVIPLQKTKPVVDFDQILDTFDKPTRDALTQLIRTASAAVQSQEGTLQQLLPDLSDLSVNSQVPTQELVTRDPEFNSILINLGVTAGQLDASRDNLAGVIDHLNTINAALAADEGKALRGYITNTDTLNRTTDAVLGGRSAAQLDTGLRQLSTFSTYLNSLLSSLIPQTETFSTKDPLAEPSDLVNSGGVPAKASIDLIYEIGSATSQGYGSHNFGSASSPDYQGNFWLRQNATGVDPCGLVSSLDPTKTLCGLAPNTGQASTPSSPSLPAIPVPRLPVCLPGLPCNGPIPCVDGNPCPVPTPSLPLPTPCLPLLNKCPSPSPCITLPLISPTPCPSPSPTSSGGGIIPTLPPLPTPSLPLGLGQTASDDVTLGTGFAWTGFDMARLR